MKILNSPAAPPSLQPANRRIVLSGEDALRILREIELLLQSLHHIGRHYYPDGDDAPGADAQHPVRSVRHHPGRG